MSEILEILDNEGSFMGHASRDEAHRLGLWHAIFHAWIIFEDVEPRLLLQRRALTTELNPGMWDISVAGHLLAGERGLDGVREIEEEIGFSPNVDQVSCVGRFKLQFVSDQLVVNEFCDVFLVTGGLKLDGYRPSLGEVVKLGYVKFADLDVVLSKPGSQALVDVVTWNAGGWTFGTEWVDAAGFGESKAALLAEVYPHVAELLSAQGKPFQGPQARS